MAANTANLANLSIQEINASLPPKEKTLTTEFNVTPYYDDYTEDKNYYRILFKPGYAVQGRELTQVQTILQKQIDRFGKHIFKEGSIVLPGEFNIELDVDYVKIKDNDLANNEIDVTDYLDKTIISANGVTAYVINVEDGIETNVNTKTLYLRYISASNSNSAITKFSADERLTSNVGTAIVVSSNPIGKAARFIIREGVFFAKEHFIRFPTQSIIIGRYDSTPTCKVGFTVLENIIDYSDDTSLLDPALESSNYAAPGADRFQLNPVLTVKSFNEANNSPDFVELFSIRDGIITELYNRSQYNILGDELAKRTLEESGDYYVRGLSAHIREHLNVNNNGGVYKNGNPSLIVVNVEPGLGYVKGYPVELLVSKSVNVEKSNTYQNVSSQSTTATSGAYIKANNFTGTVLQDQGSIVFLRNSVDRRLANRLWASGSSTGSVIGTAKVRTIEYDSGTLGSPDGVVRIYLSDIKMNGTNSFSNTRSITATNFGADLVLESNTAILKEPESDCLIYPVGTISTRTIRDDDNNPKMVYSFKRTTQDLDIINGVIDINPTFAVGGGPEVFPYGEGTSLDETNKREIILTTDDNITIPLSTAVVTRVSATQFTANNTNINRLNDGDKVEFTGNSYTYFVTSANTTHVTVDANLPTTLGTTNSISKVYKTGDVIDLTTVGISSGETRTVTLTSDTSMTIDLKEAITSAKAKISYPVKRSASKEITKILRANAYVSINTSNSITGRSGPYGLGFSDVYRIRSITNLNTGANVTSDFIFDTGQRDGLYDHATITPKTTLSSNASFLVKFDYFESSFSTGRGYYSVDSYPINDLSTYNEFTNIRTETIPTYISPKTGKNYDLRNCIDFRPIKANTAAYVTSASSAYSVNPSTTAEFSRNAEGLRLIVPSSEMIYDYSFYLPRKDVISLDNQGNVIVTKGVPEVNSQTPAVPSDTMLLASVFVTGYPSLSTNYARRINRMDLACTIRKESNIRFTMRDIGILKQRIENLEYYSSLNLLQKSALDMNVLDSNGINRFKNGIFVDTFSDHTFGEISNRDYRIIVDTNEKSIRPLYTADSFYFEYLPSESSGVTKNGNLITLPYTEEWLPCSANAVTSFRNIELTSYRFVGTLTLDPEIDTWVDTVTLPDENIKMGANPNDVPNNSTQYQIERVINGYRVDPPVGGTKVSSNYGYGGTGTEVPLSFQGPNWTASSTLIPERNSQADQAVYSLQTVTKTTLTTKYAYNETSTTEGSKIVDIGVVPYIRGQVIDLYARGLKRNTQVYVFFDGEDLTENCFKLTEAEYLQTPDQRRTSFAFRKRLRENYLLGIKDQPLITDAKGELYFSLAIPNGVYRIGQKEIVVTDSTTNSIDATTYCKNYFVASGLQKEIQSKVITTGTITSSVTRSQQRTSENVFLGYLDNPSCSAYSFVVKAPPEDEGYFMTSVELFFARKHPTLGVWFEIRAMDNASGITTTQVPYSEVWLKANQINISSDGYTNPTKITFPCPVFLVNGQQYAFVIHTEGLNPDTYLWISRLGETDVRPVELGGGQKYSSRPLTGTFYTTNNNRNWNMVDDIDLKINFYRAKFTTGTSAQAMFGNEPVEKLRITDFSKQFTSLGETIVSDYRMTLTGNTEIIAVGDYLVGANANGKVSTISGSTYYVSNTGFASGEVLTHRYASNAATSGNTFTVTSLNYGTGKLSRFKTFRDNTSVDIIKTNGNYSALGKIEGITSDATANVVAIDNFRYSKITFEPSYLNFKRTSIGFEMRTTSNAGVLGSFVPVYENSPYFFKDERALYSRSNEVLSLGGQRSSKVRVSFSSSSEFVSPVIDVTKTRTVYIDNIVNSNTTYGLEAQSSGGELLNKYISRVVTLAEGQDAEDLIAYLTVYQPPGTEVLVWCKILNRDDSDLLRDRPWIPMQLGGDKLFSSLTDVDNFKELKYVIPSSYLTGPATDNSPGGEVQYTNSEGVKYTGFKYFAIKIGLAAKNSAVVPRVTDLRAIALQI